MTNARKIVFIVLCVIGLFDMVVGLLMLFSSQPWLYTGMANVWNSIPSAHFQSLGLDKSLHGPHLRIAAFSFHIGAVTFFLGWLTRNNVKALGFVLLMYTVNGLLFAAYDHSYTKGTTYFIIKQILGGLWGIALVAYFYELYQVKKANNTKL